MNFKDMGRIAGDFKTSQTNSGKSVVRFTVAFPRPYNPKRAEGAQDADFIGCTAFAATADFIQRNFHKGSRILVEGTLRSDKYEKEGQTKYSLPYVLVENCLIIDFNKSNSQTAPAQAQNTNAPSAPADDWGSSDIPF